MISGEQWEKYEDKYGRLMHKISRNISGDAAVASLEDNYGDLCVAALESIKGFQKKTGQNFDEMFGTKLFDQYTKTCLWHMKGSKGAKITQKYPVTKNTVPLHEYPGVLTLMEKRGCSLELEDFFETLSSRFTPMEKRIADEVASEPSLVNAKGKVAVGKVARNLGTTPYFVKKSLKSLEKKIGNEL